MVAEDGLVWFIVLLLLLLMLLLLLLLLEFELFLFFRLVRTLAGMDSREKGLEYTEFLKVLASSAELVQH